MKNRVATFLKENAVLIIAFLAAIVSAVWVPVSKEYLSYIDWRVLTLLFCLMSVVAGLQESGIFSVLAKRMLSGEKNFKLISGILVLLPFFFSMLITNDVALITFVPFTILVFSYIENKKYLTYIIVIQTVAANLGSMLTPIGNPQNLFLYEHYSIKLGEFFLCVLPFAAVSLIIILSAIILIKNQKTTISFNSKNMIKEPIKIWIYVGLLLLCLLTVLRVLNHILLLSIIFVFMLVFSRKTLLKVDYGLLLTFVFFFVFSGNMAKIPAVNQALTGLLEIDPVITSMAVSQILSNVPAAVLLSEFTNNFKALLIGTNIGGLGTLIASLASLISFQFYIKTENAKPLKYLIIFTVVNIIGLVILFSFYYLFNVIF